METKYFKDVLSLKKDDIIHYFSHDDGIFYIEKGELKEDNLYKEGVEVHGDNWKQYVSTYFICKIERNGETIFKQSDLPEEQFTEGLIHPRNNHQKNQQ